MIRQDHVIGPVGKNLVIDIMARHSRSAGIGTCSEASRSRPSATLCLIMNG